MNLKEFLTAEREEKKQQKKLRKQKKTLTSEQKKYKIFGIVFGILVTFGAIFYTCNNMRGDYSWDSIIGITEDVRINLEKTVDENTILPNGKISDEDKQSCLDKLNDVSIDLQEKFTPNGNFTLSDRELATIAKELVVSVELNYLIDILDLDFYLIGETIYQKSVVNVNLSNLIIKSKLPSVYLTTVSKVEILNNSIVCLTNKANINNFDEELNEEVMSILNKNSIVNINEIGNNVINAALDIFIKSTGCNVEITNDVINFKV